MGVIAVPQLISTGPWPYLTAAHLLQDTTFGKAVDLALGVAIPVHSHIAINSVLSDYVPKSVLGKFHVPMGNLAAGHAYPRITPGHRKAIIGAISLQGQVNHK